jgi:translocation and assembly module TamA
VTSFSSIVLLIIAALISLSVHAAPTENLVVRIEGANDQQKENILAHLGTLPDTPQHRSNFIFYAKTSATTALAALGYYQPDLQVTVVKEKEPWVLTLKVESGEPTLWEQLDIQISGEAEALPAFAEIPELSGLQPGSRMEHGQYDKAKSLLLSRAVQLGFFDGELKQARLEIDRDDQIANVRLEYQSGQRYRFGATRFVGSDLVPELLEVLLPYQEGDPYDMEALNQLHHSLVQTGYFAGVKVLPLVDVRQRGQVPILVELIPAKSHRVNLGLGYATDTEERATIIWRTPVINRYGHSQETKIEFSRVNPYLRFIYDIPLSDPNNDLLQLQLGLERNDYADLTSDMKHARVGRRITQGLWIWQYYLRYLDESWDIFNDNNDSQFVMPGITLAHTWRKGKVIDPDEGFRQLYELEMGAADLFSDANIVRFKARYTWVMRFWQNHRWVVRANLGASHFQDSLLEDVPPSLRFYAGGDDSIRGFDYQSLGPTINYTDEQGQPQTLTVGGRYLAVGSLEHQYYLNDNWRVALFTDFGNAFDDVEESVEPVYSVGAGIHWLSVVGPIKIEFARAISEDNPGWRLHLNIGAEL